MDPQETVRAIEKRQARDRAIAAAYEAMASDPEINRPSPRKRIGELEAEVKRLTHELIEARLSAQEAWDAYDEKDKA